MIRRILSAIILIPLVLALIFYAPRWVFLLFIDLTLLLTLVEFFRLIGPHGAVPYPVTWPLATAIPWIWTYSPGWAFPSLVATVLLILTWCVFSTRDMKTGFSSSAGNLLAMGYLALPLSMPAFLQPDRPWELLLVLVTVWMADTGAYFTGKLWGKHKITPSISPGKSLEGYIGGLAAAVVAAGLFASLVLPDRNLGFGLLVGVTLGTLGTLGDLFESILKRGAGVKDSSNLIPGHGGVLDRIDSILFAFPGYYLLSICVFKP